MEARSYVENIANRTTMRAVILAMTKLLLAALVVGVLLLVILSQGHPAALIIGVVLLVGAGVLARDVVVLGREVRAHPLDLAFEPAPNRGLVSPGIVFGAALGLILFGAVLGTVTLLAGGDLSAWVWVALGAGCAVALMGLPTLGVEKRKWTVLEAALAARPEAIAYLQDARRRFPASAPFPFAAPTDVVLIPPAPPHVPLTGPTGPTPNQGV